MLDRITKTISISTILLILLGVFNLQQKYYWFDIKIFDYLDASEILLSFSEILMTIFFFMIVAGLGLSAKLGAIAGEASIDNPGETLTLDTVVEKTNFRKLHQWLIITVLVSTILWFVLFLYLLIYIERATSWNALWFDGLYLLAVISGSLANSVNKTFSQKDFQLGLFLWGTFISFVILFAIRDYVTASMKLSGVAKCDVELTFSDGSMLLTTKNRIYIDQCRNFIFFRELDTQKNIIIPLGEVKSISMQQLHKGL